MQSLKTIIVCKSYLGISAIRFIIKELGVQGSVESSHSLQTLLNNTDDGNILIALDDNCIPEPKIFSLDKLHNKYPGAELIAITENSIDSALQPYFKQIVTASEKESTILKKFKEVINLFDCQEKESSSEISEREQEIVKLVALGKTNKEISDLLNISTHTVITHRKNITAKLGIKTIAGLTIYAVINGIILPEEA